MEAKKVNIFAFLMMIVMCVMTICVSVSKKDSNPNNSDEILSLYKKIEKLEEEIADNKGDSAYDIAKEQGFTGNVNEWLDSLQGTDGQDGQDAVLDIPLDQIYKAYLTETGKSKSEYDYEDFLLEIASGKYNKKIATQKAYSTTVDICYSYTTTEWDISNLTVQNNQTGSYESVYAISDKGTNKYLAAGAGVIYQMFDSDPNDENDYYDTAYIITNYHVAYIENYSNDPNYIVYNNETTGTSFLGTVCDDDDIKQARYSGLYTIDCFSPSAISTLSINDSIQKHFLNGRDNEYYGIYLYGYQSEDYKLKATFVGGSADNDIAVLKIERTNLSKTLAEIFFDSGDYEAVTIGDSTELVGGEEIIAVGNPLLPNLSTEQEWINALVLTSTSGVVSSVSNDITMSSLIDSTKKVTMRLIRVDAAINGGNSGGGLYDLYGNLVGIVNAKIADEEYDNVGFVIPINIATGIADQIIYQCDGVTKSSQNTRIKTLKVENLGFSIKNGISNSSTSLDINGNKIWNVVYNVLVEDVDENSLANKNGNGLKIGDIIKQVSFVGNDYLASEFFNLDYELDDLLLKVNLNCLQISFTVSRDGSDQVITLDLNESCFKEIC